MLPEAFPPPATESQAFAPWRDGSRALIKNKRGVFEIEKFNDEAGVFASCNPLTARGHNFTSMHSGEKLLKQPITNKTSSSPHNRQFICMALSIPIILELIGLFGKFIPQRTENFSAMNPLIFGFSIHLQKQFYHGL